MSKGRLNDFVVFPREILQKLRNGTISRNEFCVFCYIRLSGNPYGVAVVSLDNIKNDIFGGKVTVNYCNKLLLQLKSQRLLHYSERTGRRGSFEVQLGDWVLPDKNIKTLDKYFTPFPVRGLEPPTPVIQSESSPTIAPASQTFSSDEMQSIQEILSANQNFKVRPSDNDTDTHKDIQNDNIVSEFSNKEEDRVPVRGFYPNTYEQQRCKEIAESLGEKHINPFLSLLKKHGIHVIERAYTLLQEDIGRKVINNKAAYFQGIVSRISNQMNNGK